LSKFGAEPARKAHEHLSEAGAVVSINYFGVRRLVGAFAGLGADRKQSAGKSAHSKVC